MELPVADNGVVDIEGHQAVHLSVSAVAVHTAVLNDSQAGLYDVTSTVDCYIKVGTTANNVAANTGYPLYAGNTVPFYVRKGRRIGAITASGAGTVIIHRKQ